jgi:hypothetical protein
VCHDAIRKDRPPIRYGDWICPKYSPTIAWPYVVSIPVNAMLRCSGVRSADCRLYNGKPIAHI